MIPPAPRVGRTWLTHPPGRLGHFTHWGQEDVHPHQKTPVQQEGDRDSALWAASVTDKWGSGQSGDSRPLVPGPLLGAPNPLAHVVAVLPKAISSTFFPAGGGHSFSHRHWGSRGLTLGARWGFSPC